MLELQGYLTTISKFQICILEIFPKILLLSKLFACYRLRFCDKLVKLNGQYLEYSIPKYLTFLFYDEEGKPEGTMYQFMKIFAEYMDFKPSLIGAANFIASIKNVERGNARIGVGAPSFQ